MSDTLPALMSASTAEGVHPTSTSGGKVRVQLKQKGTTATTTGSDLQNTSAPFVHSSAAIATPPTHLPLTHLTITSANFMTPQEAVIDSVSSSTNSTPATGTGRPLIAPAPLLLSAMTSAPNVPSPASMNLDALMPRAKSKNDQEFAWSHTNMETKTQDDAMQKQQHPTRIATTTHTTTHSMTDILPNSNATTQHAGSMTVSMSMTSTQPISPPPAVVVASSSSSHHQHNPSITAMTSSASARSAPSHVAPSTLTGGGVNKLTVRDMGSKASIDTKFTDPLEVTIREPATASAVAGNHALANALGFGMSPPKGTKAINTTDQQPQHPHPSSKLQVQLLQQQQQAAAASAFPPPHPPHSGVFSPHYPNFHISLNVAPSQQGFSAEFSRSDLPPSYQQPNGSNLHNAIQPMHMNTSDDSMLPDDGSSVMSADALESPQTKVSSTYFVPPQNVTSSQYLPPQQQQQLFVQQQQQQQRALVQAAALQQQQQQYPLLSPPFPHSLPTIPASPLHATDAPLSPQQRPQHQQQQQHQQQPVARSNVGTTSVQMTPISPQIVTTSLPTTPRNNKVVPNFGTANSTPKSKRNAMNNELASIQQGIPDSFGITIQPHHINEPPTSADQYLIDLPGTLNNPGGAAIPIDGLESSDSGNVNDSNKLNAGMIRAAPTTVRTQQSTHQQHQQHHGAGTANTTANQPYNPNRVHEHKLDIIGQTSHQLLGPNEIDSYDHRDELILTPDQDIASDGTTAKLRFNARMERVKAKVIQQEQEGDAAAAHTGVNDQPAAVGGSASGGGHKADTIPVNAAMSQNFSSNLKYFKYLLFLGGLRQQTSNFYRWYIRITVWGCTLLCFINIFFKTKSYRNPFFDVTLCIMHFWVSWSFEAWHVFTKSHHWRLLVSIVSQSKTGSFFHHINRVGIFGLIASGGAVVLVYLGWIGPIMYDTFAAYESDGSYIFLAIHGVFMTLIIVPWAAACICSSVLFHMVVLAHQSDVESYFQTVKSLLLNFSETQSGPSGTNSAEALEETYGWLVRLHQPVRMRLRMTCSYFNALYAFAIVTALMLVASGVVDFNDLIVHRQPVWHNIVQDSFFVGLGITALYGSLWVTSSLTNYWLRFIQRINELPQFLLTHPSAHNGLVSYFKTADVAYTVYGVPVTTTLMLELLSRSVQILFVALIIYNWQYFPVNHNLDVALQQGPIGGNVATP